MISMYNGFICLKVQMAKNSILGFCICLKVQTAENSLFNNMLTVAHEIHPPTCDHSTNALSNLIC